MSLTYVTVHLVKVSQKKGSIELQSRVSHKGRESDVDKVGKKAKMPLK